VDFTIHIGYGVVNDLMLKLIHAFVGFERIGEDGGPRKNVFFRAPQKLPSGARLE
jgi:hypothetical protein